MANGMAIDTGDQLSGADFWLRGLFSGGAKAGGPAANPDMAANLPPGAASANYGDDSHTPGLDSGRPSIGQRIGARSPVAPAPAEAPIRNEPTNEVKPTSNPVTSPSWENLNQPAAPSTSPAESTFSQVRSKQMPPAAPVGSNNPDLAKLAREQAMFSTPIDPRAKDPNTGKSEYAMPWWQRTLGTVANFANGFGETGAAPIYVGPGATNNRYATAEAQTGSEGPGKVDSKKLKRRPRSRIRRLGALLCSTKRTLTLSKPIFKSTWRIIIQKPSVSSRALAFTLPKRNSWFAGRAPARWAVITANA
jgi:hypothetical protein